VTEVVAEPPTDDTARLSRATIGMTAGTLLSRVTGFGRIVALAYALGLGSRARLADTYNLANTTPNIVYDLLLGGILSAFIVPVFVDHLARHAAADTDGAANADGADDGAWTAISAIVTAAVTFLLVTSVLFVVAAPWVFRIYTVGRQRSATGDQIAVGTFLLRCFAPQVLFYGTAALFTALLNARRRFFWPMAAPVLNNLVVIGVLLSVPHLNRNLALAAVRHDTGLLLWLGLGTTVGVAAQALVLWPLLKGAGVHLRFVWAPRHPAIRRVLRLAGWTLGYVVANQVSFWVALVLANREPGDVSAYSYAYVFFQLPYGVLAVSILTALVPDLAERWSTGNRDGYRERLSLGLRAVALVMLPAAAGYALLARPILTLLLRHGAAADVGTASDVLALFALGLPAFSAYLLFMRGFTATQDTRTPFVINCVQNALTIAFDLVLYPALGVQGLALGFSLAYVLGAGIAALALRRRAGGLDGPAVWASVGRMAVATALMAGVVWTVSRALSNVDVAGPLLQVTAAVVAGVTVYLLVARAMRVRELDVLARVGPWSPQSRGRQSRWGRSR
jgi:putative peptidoglycan lipid II flippase